MRLLSASRAGQARRGTAGAAACRAACPLAGALAGGSPDHPLPQTDWLDLDLAAHAHECCAGEAEEVAGAPHQSAAPLRAGQLRAAVAGQPVAGSSGRARMPHLQNSEWACSGRGGCRPLPDSHGRNRYSRLEAISRSTPRKAPTKAIKACARGSVLTLRLLHVVRLAAAEEEVVLLLVVW
jgi:hypothetical protein